MRRKIIAGLWVVFLGLVTAVIYDSLKPVPLLPMFADVLHWIWNTIFCAEFTVWQILIGLTILVVILIIIGKIIYPNEKEPEFKKYVTDEIDGYTWIWGWTWSNSAQFWTIQNIRPECPNCNTIMHYEYNTFKTFKADCPRCLNRISVMKGEKDIEALILDNLRKKEINEQR